MHCDIGRGIARRVPPWASERCAIGIGERRGGRVRTRRHVRVWAFRQPREAPNASYRLPQSLPRAAPLAAGSLLINLRAEAEPELLRQSVADPLRDAAARRRSSTSSTFVRRSRDRRTGWAHILEEHAPAAEWQAPASLRRGGRDRQQRAEGPSASFTPLLPFFSVPGAGADGGSWACTPEVRGSVRCSSGWGEAIAPRPGDPHDLLRGLCPARHKTPSSRLRARSLAPGSRARLLSTLAAAGRSPWLGRARLSRAGTEVLDARGSSSRWSGAPAPPEACPYVGRAGRGQGGSGRRAGASRVRRPGSWRRRSGLRPSPRREGHDVKQPRRGGVAPTPRSRPVNTVGIACTETTSAISFLSGLFRGGSADERWTISQYQGPQGAPGPSG